ncbi:MAG: fused MFS/spermidine synthase [Caulobacterales bacterium]|nr:fused MFS/spermidine synthase [Caulobacterales bacterium]
MTDAIAPARAERAGLAAPGLVHGLLLLSGFAGLGYQIVWTRMLTIGLGHEVFAVLAVVSAFFAGLAVGALALDGRIARSRRPGRWYAGLEALIGVWTLALIWLIPAANALFASWIGPDPSELRRWGVAFAGPLLLLLPATAAMGASLPAAERVFARLTRDGRGIGGLYGANAAGAMAGALLTAAVLAPAFGFTATLACFAAVNFICAAGALLGPARGEAGRPALPAADAGTGPSAGLLAGLFATGFLGIGYEVGVVRALSQILENTVYSFAAALAIYLLGTALGAGLYQRLYARRRAGGRDPAALAALLPLAAFATALGVLAIFAVAAAYEAGRALLGNGVGAAMLAELACAALVFGAPSAAMGALFAHLAQAARGPDGGLGAAFAANTIGGALAPLAIGVLAIPSLGVIAALAFISAGYGALALIAVSGPARRWALAGLAPAALAVALVVAGPFDRRLIAPPDGGAVRAHLEGVAAAASVVEDAAGHRHLRVNGSFVMGGTASYALDRIQGHAALLQHPAPERALFLGVGTGATLAAAAAYPGLSADAVELSPEVLALMAEFPAVTRDLAAAGDRVRLFAADARRFVRAGGEPYDVILADNFHPAKDGAGLLYTVEHFTAVRGRLAEDGLFVQWLPLHQLDLASLRLITRTFLAVFPDARLFMGNTNLATPLLALYGTADGAAPQLAALAGRDVDARLARELDAIGLDTPFALFGGFMAGPEALADFAGPGPLNTDDHPRVVFEAPRTVYAPLGPAIDRLLALAEAFEPAAEEAVDLSELAQAEEFAARLAAYWAARDAFLRLGARHEVSGDVNRDARELAPTLIAIVRMSPDFGPAYRPVVAIARQLGGTEPELARRLLDELEAASPHRPEAAAVRARLPRYRGVDRARAEDALRPRD